MSIPCRWRWRWWAMPCACSRFWSTWGQRRQVHRERRGGGAASGCWLTAQKSVCACRCATPASALRLSTSRAFFRVFPATTSPSRRFGGTGLGLTISRRHSAHGWRFATQQPGGPGQRIFEITCPKPMPMGQRRLPMPRQGRPEVLKVLLIDDNATSLRACCRSCAARWAGRWMWPPAASRRWPWCSTHQPEQTLPVVFVDYQMPGMDGWGNRPPDPPARTPATLPPHHAHGAWSSDAWAARSDAERGWLDGFLAGPSPRRWCWRPSHRHGGRGRFAPATAKPKPKAQRLRGMRVLVVEDNPHQPAHRRRAAGQQGVSVTLAANGKKACRPCWMRRCL